MSSSVAPDERELLQPASTSDVASRTTAPREVKPVGQEARPPSTSVVIPAKNEAANIGTVLGGVPGWVDEVILVDGFSEDGTAEIAKQHRPDLVVVPQKRPGKGAALRDGFSAATGDIVVMIDADGSMDPGEIENFVRPLAAGDCDLVKGSRRMPGGDSTDITPFRSIGNRFLLAFVNGLFGSRFTELCYGFMAFRRPAVERLALTADGFEIETQIVVNALKAGLEVKEVPSVERKRLSGRSNLRPIRDGMRVLTTVLSAFLPAKPEKQHSAPAAEVSPSLAAGVLQTFTDA